VRRAFSDTLFNIMEQDERVIFLTGDLGFGVFDKIIEHFPTRYLNVGVAEAQLVNCAVGLAMDGWRPLVYSIASFMTGRAFEQIRVSIGYHRLPIVIIGAGGGYTYASSGVTHHAREDFALMSLIPGMAVTAPGEPREVEILLRHLLNAEHPSYMRIGRFGEPSTNHTSPIEFGRARRIREGKDIALLTSAGTVIQAIEACNTLVPEGISPTICHFHTLSPFDTDGLDEAISTADTLIIIEDHAPQGGLEAAVTNHLAKSRQSRTIIRLGPDNELVLGNPSIEEVRERFRNDTHGIVQACRQALQPSTNNRKENS
jgi:transketolase